LKPLTDVESILESVVIGTTLGDTFLAALRRLAQANVSAREILKVARARAASRGGARHAPS
jgi:hypothetical protein